MSSTLPSDTAATATRSQSPRASEQSQQIPQGHSNLGQQPIPPNPEEKSQVGATIKNENPTPPPTGGTIGPQPPGSIVPQNTVENLVSHVPEVVHELVNVESSSVVSPLPLPQVDGASTATVQAPPMAHAGLAQPTLAEPPVDPPVVKMVPAAPQAKKTRGRFNILPSHATLPEEGGVPDGPAVATMERQRVLSSTSMGPQLSALAIGGEGTATMLPTSHPQMSDVPSAASVVSAAQVNGVQTTGPAQQQVRVSGPASVASAPPGNTPTPPVGKKKGRFVVMPAGSVPAEGLTRQSSVDVSTQVPRSEPATFPQQAWQVASAVPQMQTVMVPVAASQPGMEQQGGSIQMPVTFHMPQQTMQIAPGAPPHVMAYPSMVQLQPFSQQVLVQSTPSPDHLAQYMTQQREYQAQRIPNPQQYAVSQQQPQVPPVQSGPADPQSTVPNVSAPQPKSQSTGTQPAAPAAGPQAPAQPEGVHPIAARPVSKAKPPVAAARPVVPVKAQPQLYARGSSGNAGLGKVFYFLDQMKIEVTDADKTIKTLQRDMKHLRERNKELETECRNMKAKWLEEKTAREAAEAKGRNLKKKFRELKEAPLGVSESADLGKVHSRTNSLDDEQDKKVEGISQPNTKAVAVDSEGSNVRTDAQRSVQRRPEAVPNERRGDKSPVRSSQFAHGESLSDGLSTQKGGSTSSSPMGDPTHKTPAGSDETGTPPAPRALHKSHASANSFRGAATTAGESDPVRRASVHGDSSNAEGLPSMSPSSGKQRKATVPVVDFDPLRVNTGVVPVQMMVSVPMMGSPVGCPTRSYSASTMTSHPPDEQRPSQATLTSNGMIQPLGGVHSSSSRFGYAAHSIDPFAATMSQPMYAVTSVGHKLQPSDMQPPPPPPHQQQNGSSDPFDELASRRAPTQISPRGTPQQHDRNH